MGGWDNVWLLSDPVGHRSALAQRLVKELGVKVPFRHSDRGFAGPLEDIWNIKSARYVVTTYGTFSWVGAFLSEAVEVHKPYTTNNWANYWAEEAALFVDDQPQYIYHNSEAGRYFLTAAEVLQLDRGSAFVEGVLQRRTFNKKAYISSIMFILMPSRCFVGSTMSFVCFNRMVPFAASNAHFCSRERSNNFSSNK